MSIERERLHEHVVRLASRPRPLGTPELEAARQYVTGAFETAGWVVERRPFPAVTADGVAVSGINLVATHSRHALSGRPRFCIGAHLDSKPETPGADDNASAVAALLEIARQLPKLW